MPHLLRNITVVLDETGPKHFTASAITLAPRGLRQVMLYNADGEVFDVVGPVEQVFETDSKAHIIAFDSSGLLTEASSGIPGFFKADAGVGEDYDAFMTTRVRT